MRHQRLLFLALSLVAFHTLVAQPLTERQGCHFMKSQLPLKKLTLEETQALVKSQERSDSINILDYAISLDITDFNGRRIAGSTQLEFVLLEVATRELVLGRSIPTASSAASATAVWFDWIPCCPAITR